MIATTETKNPVIAALSAVVRSITEAIHESGEAGMSSASLYMALATQGCTNSQFDMIMGVLVDAGRVHVRNERYFIGGGK